MSYLFSGSINVLTVLFLPWIASDQQDQKLSRDEQAVIDLTNAERKKADLPPLQPNMKLLAAARSHAANMAKQDKLAHDLDGKSMPDRIKEEGYESSRAGENIAWNRATAKEAVAGWVSSAAQKDNILTREFAEIGVGSAKNAKGERYWVQVFATQLKE